MQYHALSFAEQGSSVDLIGLAGTPPIGEILRHPRITVHALSDVDAEALPASRFGVLKRGALRVARQCAQLFLALRSLPNPPEMVLVQTPPALPTLPIAWLAARRAGAKLAIDWHNFGHTILALKLGARHPAVVLLRATERLFGRRGDRHLCVSRAMAAELRANWGIDADVLYDRPGPGFAALSDEARSAALDRLGLPTPRPAVVVTSTSWTPDEDFEPLLGAAQLLDRALPSSHPGVRIIITGKGPLRDRFFARVGALGLRRVSIESVWLSWDDYRQLLGSADLGISFHRSSSGVDLPMKILDMFGSGLPVCAYDYGPCLAELVQPGGNGWLFRDASELADHLTRLLRGFPQEMAELQDARRRVADETSRDWDGNWREVMER